MGGFIKVGGSGGSTTFDGLADKATVDLPVINVPLVAALSSKQDSLVSGTNIKTINGNTLLGSGNINVTGVPSGGSVGNLLVNSAPGVGAWAADNKVVGAASGTDNAVARYDGATGKVLQNSAVTISDQGYMSVGGAAISNDEAIRVYKEGGTSTIAAFQNEGGLWLFSAGKPSYAPDLPNFISSRTADNTAYRAFSIKTSYGAGQLFVNTNGHVGIGIADTTALLDVNGTSRFRGTATFNGQIIDNVGSSGTDGQVLKKVGGLVLWSNP